MFQKISKDTLSCFFYYSNLIMITNGIKVQSTAAEVWTFMSVSIIYRRNLPATSSADITLEDSLGQ